MIYVSYAQLVQDVIAWSAELPQDLDAVVGIPRSGIVPASILSLHRNISYGDLETFCNSRFFRGGWRDKKKSIKKVLVLDDSILSGRTLIQAAKSLSHLDNSFKIYYGAVYLKPGSESPARLYYKKIPLPRIFQWNIFHGYWLQYACVDIDGVLCRDPTREENDDGPQYRKFLRYVKPHHRPSVKIHTVVTNRLEKYRLETAEWLNRWNIGYENLIMHPAKSKRQRQVMGDHALRKAAVYKTTQCKLFIESAHGQAAAIYSITKRPVLCTDTGVLYA